MCMPKNMKKKIKNCDFFSDATMKGLGDIGYPLSSVLLCSFSEVPNIN